MKSLRASLGLNSVFHPSDFSEGSEIAFQHALRIALALGAKLNIMHVDTDQDADLGDFPGIRATLERWHLIPEGSPKSAVEQLGIEVSKVIASSDKPVEACLDYLRTHPAGLVVLATHRYEGHMRWLQERVGEPIAREAGEMTLFVPHGVPGFVAREDGSVSLGEILIPIAAKPSPAPAVEAAVLMMRALGLASGTMHLLHVGPAAAAPAVNIPDQPGWTVNRITAQGNPDEAIVETAEAVAADLIVMTTEGPHGFLDGLRGSTCQRVMRRARCPVMSLPANQSLSRIRHVWSSGQRLSQQAAGAPGRS
jgi:nucleotide-binding universal stress UspA family protein